MASDFNGTARRCDNRNNINTIEEAFAGCALPLPLVPTPLWGPGLIPGKWADVCGFLKPPEALGIHPTDQSCHHEAWLHLDFVGWHDEQPQREKHDRRILTERTLFAVPLRQTEGAHQRYYERPFAFVVISRPFAHVRECDLQRGLCVCPHQVT